MYRSISPRQFATTTEIPRENLEKVHFNEFKHLLNDKNVVVIDVREPEELKELGTLPKSINIPLGEVEEALKLSNECFLQKYGQNKPQKATPIIFSCMRGRRSETAQIKALQLEYKNVKNYVGGWEEWAEKNKKE
ncbi:hypothetical protein ABEB36_005636 [Hypothenemus hampei]|uniref:Rhodanese domain-containing protein n=1 Tax=Hypothenemus hampei TaxID=57062 RepID=A0ABD1F054_HYPHA